MITRFAPSPTGILHLGNFRTALFNYLAAQADGGKFLLRIEDTDQERSKPEYAEQLQQDLAGIGLHWDLGPGIDSELGPFWQSQRRDAHERYLQALRERNLIYPCFCSEAQLKLVRKRQLGQGEAPRYDGTCAHLDAAAVQARLDQGQKPAWRLRVDNDAVIEFVDLVRGQQRYLGRDLGDFIVQKSDGSLAFMFANAIDDALMGVTHVLRGEDHLSNTPRQLYILSALGLPQPSYGHISLIVGSDGAPLSKRNGSQSLQELVQAGYLPVALVNYLARLGATFSSNDLLPLPELAAAFQLSSLVKSSARYDSNQLNYWQKQAVLVLSDDELAAWLAPVIEQASDAERARALAHYVRDNILFPSDLGDWLRDLLVEVNWSEAARADLARVGVDWLRQLAAELEGAPSYAELLATMKSASSAPAKFVFKSLRWIMSARGNGPDIAGFYEILGAELALVRVRSLLAEME